MEYEEKKQRIISWFQINNLWERFMHNRHKLRPDFDPFVEKELNEFLIAKAFVWMNTAEGTGFWNIVDNKYKEFYNNYIMKEEKSIKIEVPKGYEIDKESSTFEEIKFKKKEVIWREEKYNISGYCIDPFATARSIEAVPWIPCNFDVFATKKQAKSALAMAQISQIMAKDKRFGGPITDEEWKDQTTLKYIIVRTNTGIEKRDYWYTYTFLAFHTPEQRVLFLKENEDLVKDYLMLD